jgi:hypothetical protein
MRLLTSLMCFLLVLSLSPIRKSFASENESLAKTRLAVLGILDELEQRENPALQAHLGELIQSYRSATRPLSPGTMSIADAPYLGLVLHEKLPELYAAAYESAYAEQYDKFVVHPKLEFIFDQFLDAFLDGSLSDEQKRGASQLGSCLANKARRGKSESCPLDGSEALNPPSTFSLAGAKFGCHIGIPTACTVRRLIYNKAKPDLIRARAEKQLEGPFNKIFPKKFREEFLEVISRKKTSYPDLVSEKFHGDSSALWGPETALLEEQGDWAGDDSTVTGNVTWGGTKPIAPVAPRVSLRGFAEGLRADLGVAARLANSSDGHERGLAGALFYAAANRMLLMTGGQRASWDGKAFSVDPASVFDPAHPKAAPDFVVENFGGWGLGKGSSGLEFSPWDWANYDPADSKNPTPLKLFPSELSLGAHGVPYLDSMAPISSAQTVERMGDLAEMILGLSDFLKLTRPDAVFGPHFGSAADLAQALDPASPMIFPREGRALAIGALAGILHNLVVPGLGHIEETQVGTPQGGLGLAFHDGIRLDQRDGITASTDAVARTLVAAAYLRQTIPGDPDAPAALLALLPRLDSAIQVGALTLGAQAQNADGGFAEELTEPHAPAAGPANRKLLTTIESLDALGRAYDASHILILKLSIKAGWLYLDQAWSERPVPASLDGTRENMALLRLWNAAQRGVRPGLASEIDWSRWEARMAQLRSHLVP